MILYVITLSVGQCLAVYKTEQRPTDLSSYIKDFKDYYMKDPIFINVEEVKQNV